MRLGALLIGAMVLLAVVGPSLAPHDPMQAYPIMQDAEGEWHTHPFSPGEMQDFVLGTDYDRRDILSRLLHAFRPTLTIALLAAGVRLLSGTLVGLAGGWLGGRVKTVVSAATTAAITMPILIVALLFLYIAGRERSIWQFVLALSLTGWANTAELVSVQVQSLRKEKYIEAARSVGANDFHVMRRHVVPQLGALLPILASFDIAAVLLTVAELGFVGLFLGSGSFRSIPKGDSAGSFFKLVPGQPELSQMLSVGWDNIFQTPWLAVWAGLAFFGAVLGFTLLGEGLKRRYGGLKRPSSRQSIDGHPDRRARAGWARIAPFSTRELTILVATAIAAAALAAGVTYGLVSYDRGATFTLRTPVPATESAPTQGQATTVMTPSAATPATPSPQPSATLRILP